MWLSLVERYVRDVEAVGSNPVTSTKAYNKAICRVTNELEIDMLMCKPLRSYDLSGFLLLYNEYRNTETAESVQIGVHSEYFNEQIMVFS